MFLTPAAHYAPSSWTAPPAPASPICSCSYPPKCSSHPILPYINPLSLSNLSSLSFPPSSFHRQAFQTAPCGAQMLEQGSCSATAMPPTIAPGPGDVRICFLCYYSLHLRTDAVAPPPPHPHHNHHRHHHHIHIHLHPHPHLLLIIILLILLLYPSFIHFPASLIRVLQLSRFCVSLHFHTTHLSSFSLGKGLILHSHHCSDSSTSTHHPHHFFITSPYASLTLPSRARHPRFFDVS